MVRRSLWLISLATFSLLAQALSAQKTDWIDSASDIIREDSARALELLRAAEKEAFSDYHKRARIELVKMQHALHMGRTAEARALLLAAKTHLQGHAYVSPQVRYMLMRREAHVLRLEGKRDEALQVLEPCVALCKQNGYTKRLADVYLAMGFLNEHAGRFSHALEYADSALRYGQELKDTSTIASAYANLGNVSGQMGNPKQALENFMLALTYLDAKGDDSPNYASIYSNISIVYKDLGEWQQSLEYLRKTMVLDQRDRFFPGLVSDYNNLGLLYMEMDLLDSALHYMLLAETLGRERQLIPEVILSLTNQAFVLLRQEEFEQARQAALHALELNDNGSLLNLSQILKALYRIEEADEHFKAAFDYHRQFKAAEDSLLSIETREKRDALRTVYEAEKQAQTIATLEKDSELSAGRLERARLQRMYLLIGLGLSVLLILLGTVVLVQRARSNRLLAVKNSEIQQQAAALRQQQEQIEATLEQRELLIREVHHRVKNNLQVISSLLDLQSGTTKDPEAVRALENGQHRIMSMALVHQNLYQGDNLVQVDLEAYARQLMEEITRYMSSTLPNFTYDLAIEHLSLSIDSAVPVGLILNELITNSFKHAFHEQPAPRIYIQATHGPMGELVLHYEDNGSGFDAETLGQHKKTLGLRLIRLLSRQLGGTLRIVPPSSFEIVFKP